MTQHELKEGVRVVPVYNVDTLGAPFKVVLINSVAMHTDAESGVERISIPDPGGLLKAAVRSRAVHTRKLTGNDIRFIRQSLDVKAKTMAEFLEMTPEHFSRCENGGRVMSSASEKHFRMAAFFSTFFPRTEDLFSIDNNTLDFEIKCSNLQSDMGTDFVARLDKFIAWFFKMKIEAIHNPKNEVEIKLIWRSNSPRCYVPGTSTSDDGKWDMDFHRAA